MRILTGLDLFFRNIEIYYGSSGTFVNQNQPSPRLEFDIIKMAIISAFIATESRPQAKQSRSPLVLVLMNPVEAPRYLGPVHFQVLPWHGDDYRNRLCSSPRRLNVHWSDNAR